MTLNELINLIPEPYRDLPLCTEFSGEDFEVADYLVEYNSEYIATVPSLPANTDEAIKVGNHIVLLKPE